MHGQLVDSQCQLNAVPKIQLAKNTRQVSFYRSLGHPQLLANFTIAKPSAHHNRNIQLTFRKHLKAIWDLM
jgi:hypothetical protein